MAKKLTMTGENEILVKLRRGYSWGNQAFVDLRRLAIVYPKTKRSKNVKSRP